MSFNKLYTHAVSALEKIDARLSQWLTLRRALGGVAAAGVLAAGITGGAAMYRHDKMHDVQVGAQFDDLTADPNGLDLYECTYGKEVRADGTTVLHLMTHDRPGLSSPASTDYDTSFTNRDVFSPVGAPTDVQVTINGETRQVDPQNNRVETSTFTNSNGTDFTSYTYMSDVLVAGDPSMVTVVPFMPGTVMENNEVVSTFDGPVICTPR